MRPTILPLLVAATLVLAAAFAAWPQLDFDVSAAFFVANGFPAAHISALRALRMVAYWTPAAIMSLCAALWVLGRLRLRRTGVGDRAIIFLAVTLAAGPGVLVNVALKNHSHRPRPVQVAQFGGADAFRPWYRFDGQCARNCSFVSGEVSAAVWTVAPALLTPPPIRAASVAASLAFSLLVATLRLAFGGHFLSDVVLSAMFTLLIVVGGWRWLARTTGDRTRREWLAKADRLRDRRPTL